MGYIDVINLIIVGQHSTGKTLFIERYANELQGIVFDPREQNTRPTIGTDQTALAVKIDNKMIELKFWDTAGQERYNAICSSYYKAADGVMLVYDVTDLDSFNAIHDFHELVKSTAKTGIPITQVANKCDLTEKRLVSTSHGKDFFLFEKYTLLVVGGNLFISKYVFFWIFD